MAPDPNNPYSPPQAKLAAAHERTPSQSLALGTVGFLGFIFGTVLTLLSAIVAGILVSLPPLRNWIDDGPVPGMMQVALLIASLPGGVVGGIACGLCRGKRMWLTLGLACFAIAIGLYLMLHGDMASSEAISLLTMQLVSASVGILICNFLIAQMLRQRTMHLANPDKAAGSGLGLAITTSVLLVIAVLGLASGFVRPSSPSDGTGMLALTGGTLIGALAVLASLYLTVAYPQRWKTGTLCLLGAVAATSPSVVLLFFFA